MKLLANEIFILILCTNMQQEGLPTARRLNLTPEIKVHRPRWKPCNDARWDSCFLKWRVELCTQFSSWHSTREFVLPAQKGRQWCDEILGFFLSPFLFYIKFGRSWVEYRDLVNFNAIRWLSHGSILKKSNTFRIKGL